MFNNPPPERSSSCIYCRRGYAQREKRTWCFDTDLKLAGSVHVSHRAQWCHANALAWHHADENGLPLAEAHRYAWWWLNQDALPPKQPLLQALFWKPDDREYLTHLWTTSPNPISNTEAQNLVDAVEQVEALYRQQFATDSDWQGNTADSGSHPPANGVQTESRPSPYICGIAGGLLAGFACGLAFLLMDVFFGGEWVSATIPPRWPFAALFSSVVVGTGLAILLWSKKYEQHPA